MANKVARDYTKDRGKTLILLEFLYSMKKLCACH